MKINKISLPVKFIYNVLPKQIKREAPPCIRMEASYMVELAVVLPFFAGFMVVLLFFFQMLVVQQEIGNALLATGRELSVLYCEEEENSGEVLMAKALLLKNLEENSVTEQFVKGGKMGIWLGNSQFSGEYINLQADYRIGLPIGLFGSEGIHFTQRLKCRKWIGNQRNLESSQEEIVYITPSGEVYHRNRNCSFIQVSVSCIKGSEVENLRNRKGGKYYACLQCMKNKNPHNMMVYVTAYGDCFHSGRNCNSIKRRVFAVHLTKVKNRSACSKCGRG